MDLEVLKKAKARFDALPEGEDKDDLVRCREQVKGFLDAELPALCATDRAAVAYFVSEILTGLRHATIKKADDLLVNSTAGYALAAIDLLGWNAAP